MFTIERLLHLAEYSTFKDTLRVQSGSIGEQQHNKNIIELRVLVSVYSSTATRLAQPQRKVALKNLKAWFI